MSARGLAVKAAALALLLAALPVSAGGEFKAHGFTLPGGSVKVDEDRFRLPQQWDEALKFYRTVLPPQRYPRRTLHSQAGVRAVHIDNPRPGADADWEGANLYEIGRGEVRVYVLARPAETSDGAAPAAPPAGAKKPVKNG